jgi:hypothetical protein
MSEYRLSGSAGTLPFWLPFAPLPSDRTRGTGLGDASEYKAGKSISGTSKLPLRSLRKHYGFGLHGETGWLMKPRVAQSAGRRNGATRPGCFPGAPAE